MPLQASAVDSPAELDRTAANFAALRPRLLAVANRIVRNGADAEDVVQEVWLRWQFVDRRTVREPAAFLTTTTRRVAINELQSAPNRREICVGPSPSLPVDAGDDPQLRAEFAEELERALLLLLERLSPTERAAFVLREVFHYPYPRIAAVIQATDTASRQLVSRAHRHLHDERRSYATNGQLGQFLTAFRTAARTGDTAVLEDFFSFDDRDS